MVELRALGIVLRTDDALQPPLVIRMDEEVEDVDERIEDIRENTFAQAAERDQSPVGWKGEGAKKNSRISNVTLQYEEFLNLREVLYGLPLGDLTCLDLSVVASDGLDERFFERLSVLERGESPGTSLRLDVVVPFLLGDLVQPRRELGVGFAGSEEFEQDLGRGVASEATSSFGSDEVLFARRSRSSR